MPPASKKQQCPVNESVKTDDESTEQGQVAHDPQLDVVWVNERRNVQLTWVCVGERAVTCDYT